MDSPKYPKKIGNVFWTWTICFFLILTAGATASLESWSKSPRPLVFDRVLPPLAIPTITSGETKDDSSSVVVTPPSAYDFSDFALIFDLSFAKRPSFRDGGVLSSDEWASYSVISEPDIRLGNTASNDQWLNTENFALGTPVPFPVEGPTKLQIEYVAMPLVQAPEPNQLELLLFSIAILMLIMKKRRPYSETKL